jgi:hypothetical protein
MGAEHVIAVYLSADRSRRLAPRHLFELVGQCFSIAEAKMHDLWQKDADVVIEPDIDGFAFDCFDRAKELIGNWRKGRTRCTAAVAKIASSSRAETHTRHNRGLRGAVKRPSGTQKTPADPVLTRRRFLATKPLVPSICPSRGAMVVGNPHSVLQQELAGKPPQRTNLSCNRNEPLLGRIKKIYPPSLDTIPIR